jgi:hypothetical protein
MKFETSDLAGADFITVTQTNNIGSDLVAPVTTEQSLALLDGELSLGTISGTRTKNDRITYTINFFKKIDYSVLGNGTLYEAVGEPQIVTLGFVETASPVLTAGTPTNVADTTLTLPVTSDTVGKIHFVVFLDATTAPTLLQLADQAALTANPAGGKGIVNVPTAGTAANIALTGLTAATAYKLYYVFIGADNVSVVKTHAFTTAATPTVINALALNSLVTAPVLGQPAVTTAIDATQYTGTIAWSTSGGAHASGTNFAASTVYIATVTLTAKAGFTLTGVVANTFTYTGATTVTNSANLGNVVITFAATAAS